MAAGIDWFRWYHGTVTDPKFQLAARRSGASLPDVLSVWAALLETASQGSPRGSLSSFDADAYDVLFDFPEGRCASVLAVLTDGRLLQSDRPSAWERRQPKREREADDSTERVREHRQRKRAAMGVTPRNTTETKETPREEKSREELKATSLSPGVREREEGPDDPPPNPVTVIDGQTGLPTPPSTLAALTPAQSAELVKACKALRAMGSDRAHPGDEELAALMREDFTAEQLARVMATKALRDVGLLNDPDAHPDLLELAMNGATASAMGLTSAQHAELRGAARQVSLAYLASTLRGRRRDAASSTSPRTRANRPHATDDLKGKTYRGTPDDQLPPELRAAVEGLG